jgi:riboflavin biosynthesis pyrimidine reductase
MSEIRQLQPSGALDDDALLALYEINDRRKPWLRLNFIASIDGAATHDGLSGALGTPADRRVFDLLRRLADVIIVGAGTVRAEGYGGMRLDDAAQSWRTARGLAAQPEFAIVSRSLHLDPESEVFTQAVRRPIVLTAASAPADRRVKLAEVADVADCGDETVDTRMLRSALGARGLDQLHCEGGPHLFGAMIAEGAVDELCLTVSPRLEGGTARRIVDGHPSVPTSMRLAHALESDDGTLLLRYTRKVLVG